MLGLAGRMHRSLKVIDLVIEQSTACSYRSAISMKKHSGSLVSKPEKKNNIYQQHHNEFTALE